MRSIIIVAIIGVMVLAIFLIAFNTVGERNRAEEPWDVYDSHGGVNGSWGTEILVEYEDGTVENLNKPLPLLGVYFKDKKVTSFRYVLSTRGTSSDYETIDIDISGFEVATSIKDEDGVWGETGVIEDIVSVVMDGNWMDIYTVIVDAERLETLSLNQTYNLSFVPSGSIVYRGSSTGSWTAVPLPNWFYLRFKVMSDAVEAGEDIEDIIEDTGEKWIEIEFGSEEEILE